jgi:hypothetical protein
MAKYFNYYPKTFYTSDNEVNGVEAVTNIIARFAFDSQLKENSSAFYPYQIQDSDTPEIIADKYYGNVEYHWVVLLFNDIIDPQFDWPLKSDTLIDYIDKKYTANATNFVDDTNMPTYLLQAALNTEPYRTLLEELINGRMLGDINNNGIVTSGDALFYTNYNNLATTRARMDYIDFTMKPIITANPTKYASLVTSTTGITWAQTHIKNYFKIVTTTTNNGTITIEKINIDKATYMTTSTSSNSYVTNAGETVTVAITKDTQTYYDYEVEENESKREINLIKSDFLPQIEKEFKRVVSL